MSFEFGNAWRNLPADMIAEYLAETAISDDLRKGMDGSDGCVLGQGGGEETDQQPKGPSDLEA